MIGVRHMEVKGVRRHTGRRGVRRPAEVRAVVRRIHLLQWEQIGSVSPCQKQVVGRLSEGQPLPVPEQVTAAQGGAAVTDQAEKKGCTVVEAEVPQAEMGSYAIQLRAMTQGRGVYTYEFTRYEEAPANVAQKVIEEAKKAGDNE